MSGQTHEAESFLKIAEKAAKEDPFFLGEITIAKAYIARRKGDDTRTIELSKQALSFLPSDNALIRSVLEMNLGIAYWNTKQLEAAEQTFAEADSAARQSNNIHVRISALSHLGRIYAARGKLHQAARMYREAIDLSGRSPAAAAPFIDLSVLHYEWNHLEAASSYLHQGLDLNLYNANIDVQIHAYIIHAKIKQAQGEPAAALEVLEKAHQLAGNQQATIALRNRAAACHVQIALAQGDPSTARIWAEEVDPGAPDSPYYIITDLVPAHLMVNMGQNREAAKYLEKAYQKIQQVGWQAAQVETRLLQALAASHPSDRLAFLDEALSLAEPEGYVRTFVDQGTAVGELLKEAYVSGLHRSYVQELVNALQVELPTDKRPFESSHPQLPEALSPRELDVLELLAEGFTNQEIGERLFISINTVKTHLQNIYGKLGVSDRRQATSKALELHLISLNPSSS